MDVLPRNETCVSNSDLIMCIFMHAVPCCCREHPTHLTFHWPYSLSQPYDGNFSGFPKLTDHAAISIIGLDNTGSPDIGIIHYKRRFV